MTLRHRFVAVMLSAAAVLLLLAPRAQGIKCTDAVKECKSMPKCMKIHEELQKKCPNAKTACKDEECKKMIAEANQIKGKDGKPLFDCDCAPGEKACENVKRVTKC